MEAVATDPAMVPIKESTQQAQATTASRRSTRGVAQVTAMAQVLMRIGPFPEGLFERDARFTPFIAL